MTRNTASSSSVPGRSSTCSSRSSCGSRGERAAKAWRTAVSIVARSQPRSAACAAARWRSASSRRSWSAGSPARARRAVMTRPPVTRTARITMTIRIRMARALMRPRLQQDVPRREMRPDLALDALEGVVDGLAVAPDALPHLLVGVAVEVEGENARLEIAQGAGQAVDQRAQLFGGDHLVDRIERGRARQDLVEGRLAVGRAGRRARERDVLVQRRVLVARGRLDRGDDLARDAELGEVAEARLAVRAVVAHGLVEPDEALLDEVVGVAAGQEVRRRLQAHEAVVAADEAVVGGVVALLGEGDQVTILDLNLRLTMRGETGHERSFRLRRKASSGVGWVLSGALLPWRQLQLHQTSTSLNLKS